MSIYVLKDVNLWLGGYNLTPTVRSVNFPCKCTSIDKTLMGADWKACMPGLNSFELSIKGLHDNETTLDPDVQIMEGFGTDDNVVSIAPDGDALGDVAYSFYAESSQYSPIDGTVGDAAAYSWNASGSGKLIRGLIMENAQKTDTGTGTAREIRGMDEGDIAYVVVHCTELDATSLDIIVASDTDVSFGSATTRSFGLAQFTAIGAQVGSFTAPAGISADDCWRIGYTITGGNTNATVTVILLIP